jgi:uncharacterized protein
MVAPQIVEIVKQFGVLVKENGIRVERMLVFGSYARNNPGRWSDIDVAIVSPDFGRDRFEERIRLAKLAARVDVRIEAHPISSSEYATPGEEIMADEIRQTGIEIAAWQRP